MTGVSDSSISPARPEGGKEPFLMLDQGEAPAMADARRIARTDRRGIGHSPQALNALPAFPSGRIAPFVLRAGASIRRTLLRAYERVTIARPAPGETTPVAATEFPAESDAAVRGELRRLRAAYADLQQTIAECSVDAARLNHLAHHDALTGLPNRVLLMDRLTQALTFAKRAGTGVLVIFLDLDRFKSVNDSLGHAAGDRVLTEVAARIAGCMRGADTASRVGGDEFVLVCATADGIADAPRVAARVLAAIAAPIDVFGTPITIGASLGISLSPADAVDAAELIAKADAAMYCAKTRGRNAYNLYTPKIQAGIERTVRLELELREAIARDQFEVHYQPIVDLISGGISGAEALVRWRHPVRGLIAPREFIPFAEEHGLGVEIGACVLRAVCRQLKRFSLAESDDFSISINISADQFRRAGFVQSLAEEIAANATDPRRLSVELRENTMVGDTPASLTTLQALRRLGIQAAIDDFGTGLSSLAAMKHLPVQKLKIDRSFVRDISANAGDEAIAKTIVTLAHSLGMRVIAEGVETHEQVQKLRALGSDCLQGNLISEPLAANEFERFACSYGSVTLAA